MAIKNSLELDRLLEKRSFERINLVENPTPKAIFVEPYVLKKASAICDAVRNLYSAREWYGFLVSKDKLNICDILLERNETNHGSYTNISPVSIAVGAERAKQLGLSIIGWIHSHASFPVFFSGTDRNNMDVVLNSVSLNTRAISAYEEVKIDSSQVITGEENQTYMANFLFKLDENTDNKVRKVKLFQPVYTGWSYNIVVNDKGEHYQETSVLEEKIFSGTRSVSHILKDLVTAEREEKREVNVDEINAEVKGKIKGRTAFSECFMPPQFRGGPYEKSDEEYDEIPRREADKQGKTRKPTVWIPNYPRADKFPTEPDAIDTLIKKAKNALENIRRPPKISETEVRDFVRTITLYAESESESKIINLYRKIERYISETTGLSIPEEGEDLQIEEIQFLTFYARESRKFANLIRGINKLQRNHEKRFSQTLETYVNKSGNDAKQK